MPTIELLAEIELLKSKNKELAEQVVFWVTDSKNQWMRAERATYMSALWKSLAKMHRYSIIKIFEPQLDAQLKTICELQTENAALKKQLTKDGSEIKKERSNYMLCHNQILKQLKERAKEAEGKLAALGKDARLLAEYICDDNTSRVSEQAPNAEQLQDAAERILEATEEP